MDFGSLKRFHFVGIGGIGMSAIAEVLLSRGCPVSGSDLSASPVTERLQKRGVRVHVGHRASQLGNAQVVVVSSAVPADNLEVRRARELGMIVVHRGEMLAEIMRFKKGIAVSGTHGKSTTTAMVASVLQGAGLSPVAVVGAHVRSWSGNALCGAGPYLVVEADESDRSFLRLRPICSVVTNVDTDHLDEYGHLDNLKGAFIQFMNQVPFYGVVVACGDDPHLRPLLKKVHRPVITYGLREGVDLTGRHLQLGAWGSEYTCCLGESPLGGIALAVPGEYNVTNSLAAIAVGRQLEIPFSQIQEALKGFRGLGRRLERKGERDGVLVVDDYGHHPTEIEAVLLACRRIGGRRLVVVFQPHRYTRTETLMESLASSFSSADDLYLLKIYPAGEKPLPGVTSEKLAQIIGRYRSARYVPTCDELLPLLRKQTSSGDLLLTLGAGDVWKIGRAFLENNG